MQKHFTEALQDLLKPASELFDPGLFFFTRSIPDDTSTDLRYI